MLAANGRATAQNARGALFFKQCAAFMYVLVAGL
jgi:hypothetical protein